MVRPMREIAELSVGRGMAPQCSKALVLDRLEGRATGRPQPPRGSPLASWDGRASVRVRPNPTLGHDPDRLLFPAELVPIATHEIVEQAAERIRERIVAPDPAPDPTV